MSRVTTSKAWRNSAVIYTSYFSKYRGDNGVSIARSQPMKNGVPYYEELNEFRPPAWLLEGFKDGTITEKEFKHYYKNVVLRGFSPVAWGKRLQGKVLLCWEKPGDFCHRQIVANWLISAGFEVKEWEKTDG